MKTNTTVYGRIARFLSIACLLFISMFALDSFEEGRPFLTNLLAFGMHMIPSIILLVIIILSWKKELVGGIIIAAVGLLTAFPIFRMNYLRTDSLAVAFQVIALINLPVVITGAFFIVSHYKLKAKQSLEA